VLAGSSKGSSLALLNLLNRAFGRALETANAPVLSAFGLLVGVPLLAWMLSVALVWGEVSGSIPTRQGVAAVWLLAVAPSLIVWNSIDDDPLVAEPWHSIILYYAYGLTSRCA
jgi:hypothetical protein